MEENKVIDWSPSMMLEVILNEPDDFLKIKETLTRIGIAGHDNKLYQSCHILHKQGRYFIMHFKELFMLDGKGSTLTEMDIGRRNTIAVLLADWGLLELVNGKDINVTTPVKHIKIIPYRQKKKWQLLPKYNIGNV